VTLPNLQLSEAELEKSKQRLEAALRKDLPTLVDSFFRFAPNPQPETPTRIDRLFPELKFNGRVLNLTDLY